MSPAAKTPGALVRRRSSTTTPRSTCRPAAARQLERRLDADAERPPGRRSDVRRCPSSVTASGSIAAAVRPRWKRTPCSSCTRAKNAAQLRAQRPLERHAPRARPRAPRQPRARSDAATSMPMKLAPTTTARLARVARRDDRAAVGQRAQRVARAACRRPGSASRIGSAPVASSSASQATLAPVGERSACARSGSIAVTRAPSISAIFCSPKNAGGRSGIHSSGALPAR